MRTVKLVIIGDSGVGKTSLRGQYVSGRFSTGYRATIGTDFITKILPHYSKSDETVTLQIWDTAGQERFSSLSAAFFRGADAALLMFDVNQPATLDGLRKWWEEFKTRAPVPDEEAEDYCCVVVGNKVDLKQSGVEDHAGEHGELPRTSVTTANAMTFLQELIPQTSVCGASTEDEGDDPFASQAWLYSTDTALPHESPLSESLPRTQSIAIRDGTTHYPRLHPRPPDRGSKSRSTERSSQFGGTMTTTHTTQTIYHTPSSSFCDTYASASTSPLSDYSPSSPEGRIHTRSASPSPSSPVTTRPSRRRMTSASASTTSSTPTITPSLFTRGRSSSTTTPPSPSNAPTPTLPPEPVLPHPSLPDRRPRLFFTSAKTGDGVAPVFEYIAARVVKRWEYEEALEARTMHVRESTLDTIRLGQRGVSQTRSERLKDSCCGT